jgi:CheY-like chemotaxis protein
MTRILYVEDDPVVAELCQRWLEDAGYEVVVAEDGAKALMVALGAPGVDAIIMDIILPDMSGNEVVQRIRAALPERHIPVIALTAVATPLGKAQSTQAGIDAFHVKPVTMREFLPALRAVLERNGIPTP